MFGVDLAARDSATVGGMASTNAGGLRTVRYGNMGEQVIGLDVALPDGSVVHRHSQVRRDNTGYDLASLFVGAGGNVSSEHGVGTRKRDYVSMSRTEADIAAMRAVKTAFDPSGYLNPAVLFD